MRPAATVAEPGWGNSVPWRRRYGRCRQSLPASGLVPGWNRRCSRNFAGPLLPELLLYPQRVASRSEPVPEADARFTPLAIRLSRFFEIGAYAAVAAAIGVGVFLGTHLLQRSKTQPAQTAASPASLMPAAQKPVTAEPAELAAATESSAVEPPAAVHNPIQRQPSPAAKPTTVAAQPAAEVATSNADEGYIALMFCDPLSCGSDSQVVRMELPSPAGQDSQPQIADVVVGYDGVVRAVRIVN